MPPDGRTSTGTKRGWDEMDKASRTILAIAYVGVGCFSIHMSQDASYPTASICLGVACLAIASFILGFVNGGR